MKHMQKMCDYFGVSSVQDELEQLLPYSRLHNKVNVLVGELIARNESYRVVLLSEAAMKEKDDLLLQELQKAIEQEVSLTEQTADMDPQEAEQYKQQNRSMSTPDQLVGAKFKTKWELFNEHALKYCMHSQDIKMKRVESWQDVIIADRTILKVGFKHGKPDIEVKNVLTCGFEKAPNERYIHNSDYVWSRDAITISQAISEYDLDEDQIKQLANREYNTSIHDKRNNVLGGKAEPIRDYRNLHEFRAMYDRPTLDKRTGTHQAQGLNRAFNPQELIWRTHIEFKAFRKMYFLRYRDDYGKRVTELYTDNYKIPKEAKQSEITSVYGNKYKTYEWDENGVDMSIEVHWIPRRYECTLLGGSLFVECREVPMQPVNINNPYSSFELSYKGAVFTDRNAQSISLIERAIPYQFQYFFVKMLQNRELSKYKSFIQNVDVDQIPVGLGQDAEGNTVQDPVAAWHKALNDTSINYYSGSQTTSGGLPPATRAPGSQVMVLGTAQELLNLENLLEYIDRQISMAMGISPQRESQFSSNTNVTDNQQAIAQSHHITEFYFFKFNEVWKAALNEWLKLYSIYVEDIFSSGEKEHFIHYITPAGSEELFKVTPEHIYHNDVGLWVTDAGQEQRYHEMMMQNIHAFSQNAGEGVGVISAITKAITSGASAAEVHGMIEGEAQKQQQRMMEQQQQEHQSAMEQIEAQNKIREDVQAHELAKIELQEKLRADAMLAKAEIEAEKYANAQDINENMIPDAVEVARIEQGFEKQALDREKMAQQERFHKDKIELEKMKIRAQARKSATK